LGFLYLKYIIIQELLPTSPKYKKWKISH